MLKVCSFFSGSSGNCTYVESDMGAVLIDAGVSMKKIFERLSEIDREPDFIKALFVTHEHSDHILSVGAIARKLKIPVYATKNTWRAMYRGLGKIDKELIKPVEAGEAVNIENIEVRAFPIPHDAAEPVGYTFLCGDKKLAVATDIGEMNDEIFMSLSGCETVLIESNHDVDMLLNGNYPYNLKRRIRGKCGHLSNEEAAAVCARLITVGTTKILLGHLSDENNKPQIALETTREMLCRCGAKVPGDVYLEIAGGGKLITV